MLCSIVFIGSLRLLPLEPALFSHGLLIASQRYVVMWFPIKRLRVQGGEMDDTTVVVAWVGEAEVSVLRQQPAFEQPTQEQAPSTRDVAVSKEEVRAPR